MLKISLEIEPEKIKEFVLKMHKVDSPDYKKPEMNILMDGK